MNDASIRSNVGKLVAPTQNVLVKINCFQLHVVRVHLFFLVIGNYYMDLFICKMYL